MVRFSTAFAELPDFAKSGLERLQPACDRPDDALSNEGGLKSMAQRKADRECGRAVRKRSGGAALQPRRYRLISRGFDGQG